MDLDQQLKPLLYLVQFQVHGKFGSMQAENGFQFFHLYR